MAAAWPVHCETPVILALTCFTADFWPLKTWETCDRQPSKARYSVLKAQSPLCWRHGTLQHAGFYKLKDVVTFHKGARTFLDRPLQDTTYCSFTERWQVWLLIDLNVDELLSPWCQEILFVSFDGYLTVECYLTSFSSSHQNWWTSYKHTLIEYSFWNIWPFSS